MEDFVTWVDSSAIKKHIMEYSEMVNTHNFVKPSVLICFSLVTRGMIFSQLETVSTARFTGYATCGLCPGNEACFRIFGRVKRYQITKGDSCRLFCKKKVQK